MMTAVGSLRSGQSEFSNMVIMTVTPCVVLAIALCLMLRWVTSQRGEDVPVLGGTVMMGITY